jgi:hypothetical protein
MTYTMKPLGCDPQHIKGMSEKLIASHYENNYGGAVKRLNLITEQLAGLDFNTAPNAADYEHARQKGYMFDPVKPTREQIVQRLVQDAAQSTPYNRK